MRLEILPKEQLKIMRLAIIESIPRATLTDELENELTKEIYKSSSKINNYLNRIKLPEMKAFSLEKIDYYIDIIIKDYESVKENAYLIDPKINYNTDLNIEDSSSEEFLSDNTLEKDENSPDNCFEVVNITHMKLITQRSNILPERTIRMITTF